MQFGVAISQQVIKYSPGQLENQLSVYERVEVL